MQRNNLIYITGIPGSGKTAVCSELKKRGYVALDTDNDGIAFFYNNVNGEAITEPIPAEERTPEWRREHTWKAKRETVEALRRKAVDRPVFLCGVTSNDADELWDLFSIVFALVVDEKEVVEKRVMERSEDGYGKNPHELATLMKWQQTASDEYRKLGAVLIDASRPLDQVVDAIIAQSRRA